MSRIRLATTIAIALAAGSIAVPAAASADRPCDLKTHSVRPQTGSCVPVPDAEPATGPCGGDHPAEQSGMSRAPQDDTPTTIGLPRPERAIVRDVDEALPLILSGTALLLVLAGIGFALIRTRILPRPGRTH
jgi:hypothetical protein